MKKCVVIYNKKSGKNNKDLYLNDFEKILVENKYDVKMIESEYKGHITDIVEKLDDKIDLVISIGGDGTFNESVRGNFKRKNKLVLAHIPMGTTNDVGKMLGYSKNPIKNMKLLMDGVVKEMDICTINKIPFIYVAGFGKYMNISYETKRKSKKKFGYLAYIFNAIKNFFKKTNMHDITYEINGEKINGKYSFLAVTNATRMAGVKIFDNIKLDDNLFEVMFCSIKKRNKILKALIKFKRKGIDSVDGIKVYRGNKLKIKVNDMKNLTWCLDGEEAKINSNKIEISMDECKIMLPKTKIEELFQNKKD